MKIFFYFILFFFFYIFFIIFFYFILFYKYNRNKIDIINKYKMYLLIKLFYNIVDSVYFGNILKNLNNM